VGFGGQLSSTVVIDWLNPPLQWYGTYAMVKLFSVSDRNLMWNRRNGNVIHRNRNVAHHNGNVIYHNRIVELAMAD